MNFYLRYIVLNSIKTEYLEVIMKKKLSVLILSCFILSTPCFAHDKFNPHHKEPVPPKPHHRIERPQEYYADYDCSISDRTKSLAVITGIAGVATVLSSLLD